MADRTPAPAIRDVVVAAGGSRLGSVLVALGGLVLTCLGLYLAAPIVNTLVLTLTITVAVSPVLLALRRRGWPAWAAVLGGFLVVAGITLAFVVLALVSLSRLDDNLPYYQQRLTEVVDGLAARLNLTAPPAYAAPSSSPADGQKVLKLLIPFAFDLVELAAALCLYLFLLLYSFGEVFVMPARLRRMTGGDAARLELLRRFCDDLRSFFKLNAVMGAIAAVADTAVLLVLGVDFALLWGLLSFLLSFVPNIGFIVSMIPPALLALLQFGPAAAALVILAYCAINLLVDYVLRPRIIGRDVNVSQSVTFLGVVVWGLLLGPGGALLSVPLTLISRLLLEMASGTTRYSALIVEELPTEADGEASAVAADAPTTAQPIVAGR